MRAIAQAKTGAKLSGEEFTIATPCAAASIVNLNNSRMLINNDRREPSGPIGIELRQVATRDETQTRCSLSGRSQSIRTKRSRWIRGGIPRRSKNDRSVLKVLKKRVGFYLQPFTFTFLRSATVDMIDGSTRTHIHTCAQCLLNRNVNSTAWRAFHPGAIDRSRSYRSTHLRRATAAVTAEKAHTSGNIVASGRTTDAAAAMHPRATRLAAALHGELSDPRLVRI